VWEKPSDFGPTSTPTPTPSVPVPKVVTGRTSTVTPVTPPVGFGRPTPKVTPAPKTEVPSKPTIGGGSGPSGIGGGGLPKIQIPLGGLKPVGLGGGVGGGSKPPIQIPAKPTIAPKKSDWQKLKDDSSGEFYYFNEKTNQSQWDAPPGFQG